MTHGSGGREETIGESCPTCRRPATWRDNPVRPFCTVSCKLVDLGRWLGRG